MPKLQADWLWVGFIRAGRTSPTGQGQCLIGENEDEEWEQLPAYSPRGEGSGTRDEWIQDSHGDGQDDWLIEPPSIQPGQDGGEEIGPPPPAYR